MKVLISLSRVTVSIALVSVFLLFGIKLNCQTNSNLSFTNWQKKDGLPSNSIRAIAKDKLGFLWIGTNDGLCRYDGPNLVKVYRQPKENSIDGNSLESNNIRSLYCDSSGILWIGTRFGGLTSFNPSTSEWQTYRNDKQNKSTINDNEVLSFLEDTQGRLWIGTEEGLNLFNKTNSTFTHFKLYDDENRDTGNRSVLSIMEDDKGWIWAGTWAHGLHLLLEDDQGNLLTDTTRHFETTKNKASNNVWSLFQDNKKNFWLGTHGGGLILMHLPTESSNKLNQQEWQPVFQKYKANDTYSPNLKSNTFQTIIQDKYDNLWFGCAHGLYRLPAKSISQYNPDSQKTLDFEALLKNSQDSKSIISNSIVDLYEDEQGLIWIATIDGLSQFNWHSSHFKNFNFKYDNIRTSPTANFVIDNNKNIWVTFGPTGVKKFKIIDDQLVELKNDIQKLNSIKNATTIYSPDRNRLFVGTEKGIRVVDLKSKKTKDYLIPEKINSNIQNIEIESILEDNLGKIWFGSKVGLFTIDPTTNEFDHYVPKSNDPNSISDDAINHIIQDSNGHVWIATYKGVNRVKNPSEKNMIFEKFFYDEEDPELGPMTNQIMCVKEFNNYLYVGTSSGLCRFNYLDNSFQSYDENNRKYWIRSIENGLDNNLWVSTSEGVFQFNTNDEKFRFFDYNDGLIRDPYMVTSSFKDENGLVYFVSSKGFTAFSPEDIPVNKTKPPVYITEIEKATPDGNIIQEGINLDKIELNYNDYRLSIQYAALNYNRADKNKYLYQLEGFEENWNETKLGSPIVYTSLEPNTYTLKIKAANNDGIWNESGASLQIIQNPPFWRTWWFRLLSLFLFFGITLLAIYWYTNKIRRYNEELETFNESLSKEITQRKKAEGQLQEYNKELKRSNNDLEQFAYVSSHDLKEPLRTIGNFSSLLEKNYSEKLDDNAIEYIDFIKEGVKRMSNVIDSLLTYSTVGKKDSIYEAVDLNNMIENNTKDLAQLIKDKNAHVDIKKLPTIIGHKEQLGMVFFNLINNAIKFNTNPTPTVIIKEEKSNDQFWEFSVSDNGIGIEPKYQDVIFDIFKRLHNRNDYEGTGIGLSLCQKIILRHQGNIWFESKPNEGTTFFFTIKKNLSELNKQPAS